MEALDYQRKTLVLLLVKQTQSCASVCIIMLVTAFCLLPEKKPLNLKLTIKMLTLNSTLSRKYF